MRAPLHTPYADGQVPFRIGLHTLDPDNWLQVDDQLVPQLAEKDRLDRVVPDKVFAAEQGTEDAQREVLDLLISHLRAHHADSHQVTPDRVTVAGRVITLDADRPALKTAGLMVQEDLVLMSRNDDGSCWRIAAASLHFPSSWSLAEKFSKPLADVHAPVPGFERGTRTSAMIDRIFDRLQVALPVWRMNFSLYDNDDLFHPEAKQGEGLSNGYGAAGPEAFIRVEYQTLRKLPASGDILFTIRLHIDPLSALALHPERVAVCAGLARSLEGLDGPQLAYKGLDTARRDELVAHLNRMAADTPQQDAS